jgi:RNA polymerase sigma-70 factor (ECF subfamily)
MVLSRLNSTEVQPLFVTTHWSVVLAARETSSPGSAASLEILCAAYWYPLYVYVRRQGHNPHDAQDLTQEFFARLLEKNYLKAADREKGRFRTFLRVAMKRFLANAWDRARAQKRGGGMATVSWDSTLAEQRYQKDQAPTLPPNQSYERQWAMTLLEQTMSRLRREYSSAGKVTEFEQLKCALTAERGSIPYRDIATQLGTNEGAARVAVHRLRKRFRELFRAAVTDTVDGADEVDDELRYLVSLLG